jgi:hypothetical protein
MKKQQEMRDATRNLAAANLFQQISNEVKAAKVAHDLLNMPEATLQAMSRMSGVPAHHTELHVAMMRGRDNDFSRGLEKLDGWFQPGDLILMTGNPALANAQKALYKNARSSHVAIVHADFICIDAIPKIGASNRVIPDVLADVQPGWRVIRHKLISPDNSDDIMRACAFYLAQPYKIRLSKKSVKKFAYCSELARKVYRDIGVVGTGIPDDHIIAPAHFDQLADQHPNWEDVTESLRPAVEFCQKYPEILRSTAKLFIDGLKLNRSRFEERTESLARIQSLAKAGKMSREEAQSVIAQIREIERNMNHTFWDVPRNAGGLKRPSGGNAA